MRTGGGVRWAILPVVSSVATGAFFRPGYVNNVAQNWLPALDGMADRLKSGAKVADVGCGVGFSTLLMAKAFPTSNLSDSTFMKPQLKKHANTLNNTGSQTACDSRCLRRRKSKNWTLT